MGDVTIDQSAGGTSTLGTVTLQKMQDSANSAYFLDPAATGNSLVLAGTATASGNLTVGQGSTIRSAFGPLQLQYKSALDSWATGLTLQDTTGNVGIGTTSPSNKLHVVGTVKIEGSQLDLNDAGTFIISQNTASSALLLRAATNSYIRFDTNGANARMTIDTAGNVGIGTTSPSTKLDVVGTITGTTKNFMIDHPTKPGMKLIHSTLEGPEVAVFYRGEARLAAGKTVVVLPEYFEALTRKEGRTVQLTAKNGWSPLSVNGEVTGGRFTVKADSGNPGQEFYWEVKAVRSDVDPLVVEKSVQ
ncbi:hypothetical protein HY339_00860 [Candidatus Gottesmanbacteria bacterium]|nr:hypothetical protein [Candidatus Gottesmanbacteria bacterium]